MNQVQSQVSRARRRLFLGRFGRWLCYAMFAALLIATIAIAVPAIWFVPVDYQTWVTAWLAGSVSLAFVVALVAAAWTAPSVQQTAEEVDRRFGLRERISSSVGL